MTKMKTKASPTKSGSSAVPKKRTSVHGQDNENLPAVSKQTAGAIAGAMVGGIVAGPVGAIAGGVAGAMVGNASADGQRPIGKTVANIRAVTEEPARRAYARLSTAVSRKMSGAKKSSKSAATANKPAAKKAKAPKASAQKTSGKKKSAKT